MNLKKKKLNLKKHRKKNKNLMTQLFFERVGMNFKEMRKKRESKKKLHRNLTEPHLERGLLAASNVTR
jgi:hypothetical protein